MYNFIYGPASLYVSTLNELNTVSRARYNRRTDFFFFLS